VTLVCSVLAGTDGQHRGRSQADDQDCEECGEPLPPPHVPSVGTVAGVEEVAFGLAERRVAGGVGGDPGGGAGGGGQQGAAVKVGRVAGVAGLGGGGGVQPWVAAPVRARVGASAM